MQNYYAHGKLLLSGEYLVLNGALALALPCTLGQRLSVQENTAGENNLHWKSMDSDGKLWTDILFSKKDFSPYRETLKNVDVNILATIEKIVKYCRAENPAFLITPGETVLTHTLEFPLQWGLGSSATLINNMSKYASINPFLLNEKIFGGSGYDIACAQSSKPLLFKIDDEGRVFDTVHFSPPAIEQIYFVHLNKKQNSKEAIQKFKLQNEDYTQEIEIISEITEALLFCDDADDFMQLIDEHENIMEYVLQQEKIKTSLFNDFNGVIKSLGAWGGDFIFAMSTMEPNDIKAYFAGKGYTTSISYNEMILH